MEQNIVVVFTAKSIERILKEGGTSAWRLDRNHARRCAYVVCTRNAHSNWGDGPEDHQSAFLIGKVSDVVRCQPTPENEEAKDKRYLIKFSEFARVNVPNVWKGDRNPVKYASPADLNIDIASLEWKIMPVPELGTNSQPEDIAGIRQDPKPLTLAEAKRGLAMTFNVPSDAIEITIRG